MTDCDNTGVGMHVLDTIYSVCAIAGATLFLCQFALSLFGLAGHDIAGDGHDIAADGHDIAADSHAEHAGSDQHAHGAGASLLWSLFTFRSIVAMLMFFGVAGLAAESRQFSAPVTFIIALAAGLVAMVVVGLLMRSIRRLQSEGNVYIRQSIGQRGVVYLTVPGKKSGAGKVNVSIRNTSTEYQAVTAGEQLPSGAKVVVVDVAGPGTVEVVADNEHGRNFNV